MKTTHKSKPDKKMINFDNISGESLQKYPNFENVYDLLSLREKTHVFENRIHAGEVLSGMLDKFENSDALILAIPAGGVPIAAIMAERLVLQMDVAVVSKITLPWNTEAGYGAVAFDGTTRLNEPLVKGLGLKRPVVEDGIRKTTRKVERRIHLLRGEKTVPVFSGRTVILVDDGLASGFTMRVAVEAVKKHDPEKIIVASPTGHLESIGTIAQTVQTLYCANIRSGVSFAVADAYRIWTDVSEDDVIKILKKI